MSAENAVGLVVAVSSDRLSRPRRPLPGTVLTHELHHCRPPSGRSSSSSPSSPSTARWATTWPASTPASDTSGWSSSPTGSSASTPTPTSAGRSTCAACWPSPSCRSSRCTSSCGSRPPSPSRLGFSRRHARPGVEHRGLVRHQHELAVLLGRVDHGLPRPDGRPRRAELRLGRRRHRRRDRPRARARTIPHRPARQLLGRPSAAASPGSCCRWPSSSPSSWSAGGARPELRPVRRPDDAVGRDAEPHRRAGRLPGGHQGARNQRRRLLQRQRRPPVRERPAAWTNLLEIFLLLAIPFSLPRTFGRMVGSTRQGYAIVAAMATLFIALARA